MRSDGATAEQDLSGRVAVVTGAGAGLGRAAAHAFAAAGAAVVANDVDEAAVEETVAQIKAAGGSAEPFLGDVSEAADVEALVALAESAFGGLDIMHANAAISVYRELESMDDDELQRILAVNLRGALLCARAAIPALKRRGGGSIIFVSSVQAFQGLPGCVVYAAAKAGLVAAARTLSVELGPDGIRVNAIAPGTIDTPMLRRDLEGMNREERQEFVGRVESANSLGRIGDPGEIGAICTFLASERASYVTGSCIPVDGGFLAVKSF